MRRVFGMRWAMVVLLVGGTPLVAAAANQAYAPVLLARTDAPLSATVFPPSAPPTPTPPAVIAPVVDPAMPLSAGPVDVPLHFRIPAQAVDMPVVAVGRARGNLIDAPEGPADDPIWTKAFWFRGGARPGEPGVTTIIGHVDDPKVRLDPFSAIRNLHPGDIVEVADQRTGGIVHYRITATQVIWNASTHSNAELSKLFGAGAVTQRPADKAADAASGVARLTLMTCTGQWRGGGFDRRFFAFGVRDDSVAASS